MDLALALPAVNPEARTLHQRQLLLNLPAAHPLAHVLRLLLLHLGLTDVLAVLQALCVPS